MINNFLNYVKLALAIFVIGITLSVTLWTAILVQFFYW